MANLSSVPRHGQNKMKSETPSQWQIKCSLRQQSDPYLGFLRACKIHERWCGGPSDIQGQLISDGGVRILLIEGRDNANRWHTGLLPRVTHVHQNHHQNNLDGQMWMTLIIGWSKVSGFLVLLTKPNSSDSLMVKNIFLSNYNRP